jgi:hypothetical protein
MNVNNWTYNDTPFEEPDPQHYGFVYLITNNLTGKMYIGKKVFWFKKTKQVNKKKKKYLAPSDWKEYYGSSPALNKDVALHGAENFKREILHLCANKGLASYYETLEQFQREVLFNPEQYYNDWIIVRVHRKHVLNEIAKRNPIQSSDKSTVEGVTQR